ncbi:hypothetical protein [Desulfonema magnum]|nr:hypothetical protein [Desulfonema magnum]
MLQIIQGYSLDNDNLFFFQVQYLIVSEVSGMKSDLSYENLSSWAKVSPYFYVQEYKKIYKRGNKWLGRKGNQAQSK